jgi:CHASE3 domain sensor protein
MKTSRVVVLASVFTVIVTLYSLSELQRMTAAASQAEQSMETRAEHADWRLIAKRAVHHVENLPLHAGSLFHRSAIQGA